MRCDTKYSRNRRADDIPPVDFDTPPSQQKKHVWAAGGLLRTLLLMTGTPAGVLGEPSENGQN